MKKNNKKNFCLIIFVIFFLIVSFLSPIIVGHKKNFENKNISILLEINKIKDKKLLEDKIIGDIKVKYWNHVYDNITIKNDYILLHLDKFDNIIKFEKKWTDLKDIYFEDRSNFCINKNNTYWYSLVLFPEKKDLRHFYFLSSKKNFPLLCCEIRNKDGSTDLLNLNGSKIGYGISAPSDNKGFSLSGYCIKNSPDCWIVWRKNADNWFQKWCSYSASLSLPKPSTISSYVENEDYHFFYELAHGSSTYFQANLPGIHYFSSQLSENMGSRQKMKLAFIGSCEGMTNTGSGTFSYEFRKGSMDDTVTIGYSGMGSCPGWSVSLEWQDFLFYAINENYTFKNAFNMACAEYPTISDCVIFIGDSFMKITDDDNQDGKNHPNVLITFPNEDSIVNNTIKITGISDDIDGDVEKIYVRVDEGPWNNAIGTNQWEFFLNTTKLKDGLHKISVIAIDNNNFHSNCCNRNIYIINNQLKSKITVPAEALSNNSLSFYSDISGGLKPYNYTWYFGDGTFNYNRNTTHFYKKPGEYTVIFKIKDIVNNTQFVSKKIRIYEVDCIAPTIEIIKPKKALYVRDKEIIFFPFALIFGNILVDFSVKDIGGSGVSRIEIYIDNILKNKIENISKSNFSYMWDTNEFFYHKIMIKTYDFAENKNIKKLNVIKFF